MALSTQVPAATSEPPGPMSRTVLGSAAHRVDLRIALAVVGWLALLIAFSVDLGVGVVVLTSGYALIGVTGRVAGFDERQPA